MHFVVNPCGALRGKVRMPGDRMLSLALLSYGMLLPNELTILKCSTVPDVEDFIRFLKDNGARVETLPEGVKILGSRWGDSVILDERVPLDVLHGCAGSMVFLCSSVRISGGFGQRRRVVESLLAVLERLGLDKDSVARDGKDCIITGGRWNPPGEIVAGSSWELEIIASALCSVRGQAVITYPGQQVSHVHRMIELIGFSIERNEDKVRREHELNRRLSRAAGNPQQETRMVAWTGGSADSVAVPGDTVLASAVGGLVSLVQRSEVTIEGILWEQGRRGFFDALRRMKIPCEWTPSGELGGFETATVAVRSCPGEGIHFTENQSPLLPAELLVLGVIASCIKGKTVLSGGNANPAFDVDYIRMLARGLERMGAHIGSFPDGLAFEGVQELRGAMVDSIGSPDCALAFAVAGSAASGATTVDNYSGESHPVGDFFRILKGLRNVI